MKQFFFKLCILKAANVTLEKYITAVAREAWNEAIQNALCQPWLWQSVTSNLSPALDSGLNISTAFRKSAEVAQSGFYCWAIRKAD